MCLLWTRKIDWLLYSFSKRSVTNIACILRTRTNQWINGNLRKWLIKRTFVELFKWFFNLQGALLKNQSQHLGLCDLYGFLVILWTVFFYVYDIMSVLQFVTTTVRFKNWVAIFRLLILSVSVFVLVFYHLNCLDTYVLRIIS